MEPLTILSLASAVAQFIDFGGKVLAGSKELYQSTTGESSSNVELQTVVADLRQVSDKLALQKDNADPQRESAEDKKLRELAASCKTLSQKLLATLEDLAVKQGSKTFQSVRQALRSVWKEKQIREVEKQLESYRGQLTLRLVSNLKSEQSELLRAIKSLAEQHKALGVSNAERLESLSRDISSQLQQLKGPSLGSQRSSSLSDLLTDLREEYNSVVLEQKILKTLAFEHMGVRRERISDPHQDTFSWIFQQYPRDTEPRHDFVSWLNSQNGIYWISGKAGCGKSTLLKYICNAEETRRKLNEWAQPQKLVTASFFFWNAGTELEKSQEGLFRSILYEILRRIPHVFRHIFPERWERGQSVDSFGDPWTRSELLKTLDAVLTIRELGDIKFCFFIDGLDEYSGEHSELIRVVEKLSSLQNVKICVSSRPWNVFNKAFAHVPDRSLMLHEFTKSDIAQYVHDQFRDFSTNLQVTDDLYADLVEKIVEDAKGVFLWVYLAVRYLSQGFLNQDNVSELHRRLAELPPDLETFYTHMLNSIEPFYRCQTAQILLVCLASYQPPNLISLSFLDEDPEFAVSSEIKPIKPDEIAHKVSEMKARVNARCKDLLEVYGGTSESEPLSTMTYKVEFLHRTVKDFLLTSGIFNELQSRVDPSFDADLWLCRINLAHYKCYDESYSPIHPLDSSLARFSIDSDIILETILYHASLAERKRQISNVELLRAFGRASVEYDKMRSEPFSDSKILSWGAFRESVNVRLGYNLQSHEIHKDSPILFHVFSLGAAYGLRRFVEAELERDPTFADGVPGSKALLFALGKGYGPLGTRPYLGFNSTIQTNEVSEILETENNHTEIIRLLLDKGANPNHHVAFAKHSPWTYFLERLMKATDLRIAREEFSRKVKEELITVTELFISHGASLDVRAQEGKFGRFDTADKILVEFFGERSAAALIKKRTRSSWFPDSIFDNALIASAKSFFRG